MRKALATAFVLLAGLASAQAEEIRFVGKSVMFSNYVIIRSLLDTDFYKLLMAQTIFRRHRDARVTFGIINRSREVPLARLIDKGEASSLTYELGGPEVFSFKQLMEFTLETIGRKRLLVPVPWPIAKVMGTVMGLLPFAPLTADQVELLKTDNVVSEAAAREGRDLTGLGITGRSIQGIVPSYLYRYRRAGQFTVPKGIPE